MDSVEAGTAYGRSGSIPWADILKMRRLYRKGYLPEDIKKHMALDISPNHISNICQGKIRKKPPKPKAQRGLFE